MSRQLGSKTQEKVKRAARPACQPLIAALIAGGNRAAVLIIIGPRRLVSPKPNAVRNADTCVFHIGRLLMSIKLMTRPIAPPMVPRLPVTVM